MRRRRLLVLGGLALAGCALLPTGGAPTAARAGRPCPLRQGLREYRAAVHVHCHLSHDSEGTIEEIAAAARGLGLDAVFLNDHYEPGNIARAPRGVRDGVLFIPGVEMRGGGGSILAFNLNKDFDKKAPAPDLLQEFARQGAAVAIGHVEEVKDWDLEPFQAFEVYNLHAEFKAAERLDVLGRLVTHSPDAFFEASITNPASNLELWDRELARGRRLAPVGGHDAHANVRLFGPLGGTIGTYPEILRLFSTHILAPELSSAALTEGIRAGRTFVVFDYLGSGSGFEMTYGDRDLPPEKRATLGDTATFRPGHAIEVLLPAGAGEGATVKFIEVGKPPRRLNGSRPGPAESGRWVHSPEGPGPCRVEVYRGERLWIVSAPIYIVEK